MSEHLIKGEYQDSRHVSQTAHVETPPGITISNAVSVQMPANCAMTP